MRMNNMVKQLMLTLLCLGLALGIAACSNSSHVGEGTPGGIDRGGLTMGTVSGFGSVYVNGIKFDTTDTEFFDEELVASEEDLAVGHQVLVRGSFNSALLTGKASSIVLMSQLVGPVAELNVEMNTLTVLGHQVRVNDETLFDDGVSLVDLQTSGVVRIFGLAGLEGIVATRIEKVSNGIWILRGELTGIDKQNQTFQIKEQVIDYSQADFSGLSESDMAAGIAVKVQARESIDGVVIAERILNEAAIFETEASAMVSLEGLIEVGADAALYIAGRELIMDANTRIVAGDLLDLVAGARVSVEGEVQADGAVQVTKIQVKPSANLKLEGAIEAIDVEAGTITINGVVYGVAESTQYIDQSELNIRRFDLSDLSVGDWVSLKAHDKGDGLSVNQVKREVEQVILDIKGPISDFSLDSITVLGNVIIITDETDLELDLDALLTKGLQVEVTGSLDSSGAFLASSVALVN